MLKFVLTLSSQWRLRNQKSNQTSVFRIQSFFLNEAKDFVANFRLQNWKSWQGQTFGFYKREHSETAIDPRVKSPHLPCARANPSGRANKMYAH